MNISSQDSDVGPSSAQGPGDLPREVADDLASLLAELREPTPGSATPKPIAPPSSDHNVNTENTTVTAPKGNRHGPAVSAPSAGEQGQANAADSPKTTAPSGSATLPDDVAADLQSLFRDIRETDAVATDTAPSTPTVAAKSAPDAHEDKAQEDTVQEDTAQEDKAQKDGEPERPASTSPADPGELRDLLVNLETLLIDLRDPKAGAVLSMQPNADASHDHSAQSSTGAGTESVQAPSELVSIEEGIEGAEVFAELTASDEGGHDRLGFELVDDATATPASPTLEDGTAIPDGWSLGRPRQEPSGRFNPAHVMRRLRMRIASRLRSLRPSEWRNQRRHRRDNRRYSDQLY